MISIDMPMCSDRQKNREVYYASWNPGLQKDRGKKDIRAIVLFPTPPFPLATARTLLTFGIGLFTIGPAFLGICGGSGRLGRPFVVHLMTTMILFVYYVPEDFHGKGKQRRSNV